MIKQLILLILGPNRSMGELDHRFYKEEGILTEQRRLNLAFIRQKTEQEVRLVMETPVLSKTHIFPTVCGKMINTDKYTLDYFNEIVQHLVLESFKNSFVVEIGAITPISDKTLVPDLRETALSAPSEAAVTATPPERTVSFSEEVGDYDEVFPTLKAALLKFINTEHNVVLTAPEIAKPEGLKTDIQTMFDNDVSTGFEISTFCKNEKPEVYAVTAVATVTEKPIVHIILTDISIVDMPEDDDTLVSLWYYTNQETKETVKYNCYLVDMISTEFLTAGDEIHNATVVSARCPDLTEGPRRKEIHIQVHMRLSSTSPMCDLTIREILVQRRNGDWYGAHRTKHRNRRQALAAAAGLGIVGTGLYSYFHNRGLSETVGEIENAVHENYLLTEQGASNMLEMGKKVTIELDTVTDAVNQLASKECILTRGLNQLSSIMLAESLAKSFVSRIFNLMLEAEGNLKGNIIQNTVQKLCNNANRAVDNRQELCDSYYAETNQIKLKFVQAHRSDNIVRIIIVIDTHIPDLYVTKTSVFDATSIPIPLGPIQGGIFRYRSYVHVPNRYIHLHDYNQTLAVAEASCLTTADTLFCGQEVLDSIYTLESSCINAIVHHGNLDACGHTVIASINDCIIKVKPKYVIISSWAEAHYTSHKADALSIHRQQNNDLLIPAGVSALSKLNITTNGYLHCKKSKVYIEANRLSTEVIKVTVSSTLNTTENTIVREIQDWQQMNDIFQMSNAQLTSVISKLDDNELPLRNFIKNIQDKRGPDMPNAFLERHRNLIRETVIPYSTVALSVLSIVSMSILGIALIKRRCSNYSCYPACYKVRKTRRARFKAGSIVDIN